jgi:AcrR family transcriptional regulator
MSIQARREREKKERQETILDAAEAMFFDKGYERTAMDEIARTAHLSRALLYVYFKDKSAILRGITLRAGEELRRRFAAAADRESTGLAKIAALGWAYYRFCKEKPDYFDVLTHAASLNLEADDAQSEALKECDTKTMEIMVSALRTGMDDGSLCRERIKDPLETALYLRGALHGVIMLSKQELSRPRPLAACDPDSLVRHTMQMLMVSLRN